MFGKGLVMAEGQDWLLHRHDITRAFSPSNLKVLSLSLSLSLSLYTYITTTTTITTCWPTGYGKFNGRVYHSHARPLDVPHQLWQSRNRCGERNHNHGWWSHSKAIFGISCESGKRVIEKITAVQVALFKSNRFVGVPYSNLIMCPKRTLQAKIIGNQINALLHSIIKDRREKLIDDHQNIPQKDLLCLLLAGNLLEGKRGKRLTTRELVDECKTFFFAGQETSALLLTWTMMLLAIYPEWQDQLREEIQQVVGDGEVDPTMLAGLKKVKN